MKNGRYEVGGNIYWFKDDVLHREDGPAIEMADGSTHWWLNGMRHRIGGPAIEYPDGSKEWICHVVPHRLDGPAVIWANGDADWRVDGQWVDVLAIFGYLPSIPLTEEEQMILRLAT